MYKTTNMIIKNPIYLLSKNNATAVITYNEITQEILIEDKANGFCLTCDGGIILVESTKGSNFEIIQ